MSPHASEILDLDHVVMADGRIYRVVGNLDHPSKFVGYNVYSPDPGGDRLFRGTPYRKNFTEDDELPQDALDTYVMLPKARIREHLDPRTAAASNSPTFAGSPWAGLHAELTDLFQFGARGRHEMEKPCPAVSRMRVPFDQSHRLELVDDAAKRNRFDFDKLSESRLINALVLREVGQNLPLRSGET